MKRDRPISQLTNLGYRMVEEEIGELVYFDDSKLKSLYLFTKTSFGAYPSATAFDKNSHEIMVFVPSSYFNYLKSMIKLKLTRKIPLITAYLGLKEYSLRFVRNGRPS